MKPANCLQLICFIAVVAFSDCGRSDEGVKEVIKAGTEIAGLQQQYYPVLTELGKVAIQIEAIAERQDPTAKAAAGNVAKAHELIAEAFAAGQKAQDGVVVGMPRNMDVATYMVAREAERRLLKEALDKTKAAVNKSHEVLDALANAKTAKGVGKK